MYKSKSFIYVLFSLSLIFSSCNDIELERKYFNQMVNCDVVIPDTKLINEKYSLFNSDTVSSYYIIHVLEFLNCVSCVGTTISSMEHSNYKKQIEYDIHNLFVVKSSPEFLHEMQRELCQNRIKSVTYIDTCNAFLSANPQIPDNELFHTFVINNEGKVLMVGNPFQNEKMETLLKKVIANERKKHKTKKSA